MGFPCGSAGKEAACNAGDLGTIPELERSPGEGKGYPLQYSGLDNSMDCIVHGVIKSWTRLSKFHFATVSSLISLPFLSSFDLKAMPGKERKGNHRRFIDLESYLKVFRSPTRCKYYLKMY